MQFVMFLAGAVCGFCLYGCIDWRNDNFGKWDADDERPMRGAMNKERFIKLCGDCGYSSEKVAKAYAEGREEFYDEDFIHVSRIARESHDPWEDQISGKWRGARSGRTTKRFDHWMAGKEDDKR